MIATSVVSELRSSQVRETLGHRASLPDYKAYVY